MRHRLEYLLVLASAYLARFLPTSACRKVLQNIGLVFYFLSRRYRRVALENLKRIHPGSDRLKERQRIAKASFRNLGRMLSDILRLSYLSGKEIEALVDLEGWEHLERAIRRGKGVLLFSAHFGNWEIVPLLQGSRGYTVHIISRPLDNPYLEKYLNRVRSRSGNLVIPKQGAIRKCIRPIRKGGTVAIVIDQKVRWDQGVSVDFLGKPAATTRTLARLAMRYRCAVVPVFSIPLASGRFRVKYEPEVPLPPDTGSEEDRVRQLTQQCTRVIEKYVRKYPEFCFWMHRRWHRSMPEPVDGMATTARVDG